MASIPKTEDEKLNLINIATDGEKLKLIQQGNDGENQIGSMFNMMEDLIRAMQQKMIVVQIAPNQPQPEPIPQQQPDTNDHLDPLPKTQAAILLHQVQTAMESTIAQLSSRGLPKPDIPQQTDEPIEEIPPELSTSEKWRLYTELVQKKGELPQDYCRAKMRLGQALGLSFRETKREMLIGLWSNRLCMVLYLNRYGSEDEILDEIEEWERIERARTEVYRKYRNRHYKLNN